MMAVQSTKPVAEVEEEGILLLLLSLFDDDESPRWGLMSGTDWTVFNRFAIPTARVYRLNFLLVGLEVVKEEKVAEDESCRQSFEYYELFNSSIHPYLSNSLQLSLHNHISLLLL